MDWAAGCSGAVAAADYGPDGEKILVGGADGKVRLWDARQANLLRVYRGHLAPVTGVRIHPTGVLAATASMDGSVRLWDVTSGRELYSFTDNQGPVSAVLFIDGGEVLVSAAVDGNVRVRDTRTGRLPRAIAAARRDQGSIVLTSESRDTLQVAAGGSAYSVLAGGQDEAPVLLASMQDTVQLGLLRPNTPRTPPIDSEPLHRSLGWRVTHPDELTLV